ncbi:MAG TPA: hypothetical protein DCY13_13535 [Verrucomicrobiales bacterium]|nr:hypothetical protein [Verrucomicrobiales bacterium]
MKTTVAVTITSGLLALTFPATADTAPAYAAHEWGTFTSVQGSDGELIAWNPFVTSELPDFVYDRRRPFRDAFVNRQTDLLFALGFKYGQRWLQRMETPVIYFHATNTFTVDVEVGLPDGLVTEWYPAVTTYGPAPAIKGVMEASRKSHVRWDDLLVHGLPGMVPETLPAAPQPNHYFAARETSANTVQVQRTPDPEQAGEVERFLFYRGAANFTAPLHASIDEQGQVVLRNAGNTAMADLFVYRRRGDRAEVHHVPGLEPKEQKKVSLLAIPELGEHSLAIAELTTRLQQSLEATGLYEDEARAMINTWKADWFDDQGLRALYLLPQSWTDEILPLQLTPQPRELVRVMVGRAEILERTVEQKMELLLTEAQRSGGAAQISSMVSLVERRFVDPALTRAANVLLARERERLAKQWPEPALTEQMKKPTLELNRLVGSIRAQMSVRFEELKYLASAEPASAR